MSQALWLVRSTHARAVAVHGVPATVLSGPPSLSSSANAVPAKAAPARQDMPSTVAERKATRRFNDGNSLLIRTFSQPERANPAARIRLASIRNRRAQSHTDARRHYYEG